jgi:hypothetical protein
MKMVLNLQNPVNDNCDFRNNDNNVLTIGPNLPALKLHTIFGMAGENIANSDTYIINNDISITSAPNYY